MNSRSVHPQVIKAWIVRNYPSIPVGRVWDMWRAVLQTQVGGGRAGTVSDLEPLLVRQNGGVGETVGDLWRSYLSANGYAQSNLREAMTGFFQTGAFGISLSYGSLSASGAVTFTISGATAGGASVFQGTTPGGESATPIVTAQANGSYTVSGLTNGTQYYFYAKNTDGTGSQTAEISAIPLGASTLTLTAGNNSMSVAFTSITGASTYDLYRSTATGTEVLVATGITTSPYSDTGLTNGTTYYYKLAAVNSLSQIGVQSSEASAAPGVSDLLANLKASWKFDNDATDATGNGFAWTLNNSPTYGTGLVNQDINFVAASQQTLSQAIPSALQITTTSDWTFAVWINPTSFATSSYFLSWGGNGTDPNNAFESFIGSTGALTGQVGNAGASLKTAQPATHLTTGSWQLVVLRMNSATTTFTVSVGDPTVANNKSTNATAVSANGTSLTAVIGSYGVGGSASFDYNGGLDAAGFWIGSQGSGACLSDAQVNELRTGAVKQYPFS